MPDDFTGANSDKIDKLIVAVIEFRTTMRLCFAIIGVGVPLMVGLLAFLVFQSFNTSAKVDQLTNSINEVQRNYDRLSERLWKFEPVDRPRSHVPAVATERRLVDER